MKTKQKTISEQAELKLAQEKLTGIVLKEYHTEIYRVIERFYNIYDKYLIINVDIIKSLIQNGIIKISRVEVQPTDPFCEKSYVYYISDKRYFVSTKELCTLNEYHEISKKGTKITIGISLEQSLFKIGTEERQFLDSFKTNKKR
jgi:hypothetical protein